MFDNMYSDFVKRHYKLVYETEEEAVYLKKYKLVVFVKNEDTGKKIYSIAKTLKALNVVVGTQNMSLKIDKYIINKKEKRVQVFRVDFHNKFPYLQLSALKQLQENISLIDDMGKKGFVLDSSKFEDEKCYSISSFLSFFSPSGDEIVDSSKGYFVKYIHYVLSGGENFDEYYQNIADNAICNVSDFPYCLPVIKMCYNYFKTGNVPENFNDILKEEEDERNVNNDYCYYLITSRDFIRTKYKVLKENDEYIIYDGNIKIYHNKLSSEFSSFLRHDIDNVKKVSDKIGENLEKLILDFDGNVIGYTFKPHNVSQKHKICDNLCKTAVDVIDFCSKMISTFWDIRNMFYNYSYDNEEEINDNANNNFNISESLLFYHKKKELHFIIPDIHDLCNLVMSDTDFLRTQATEIFFKLYLKYLNNNYGKIQDKEQLYDKLEVRFLPPVIAREFVLYSLKGKANYKEVTDNFFDFLYRTKQATLVPEKSSLLYYDSNFEYNPCETPFLFDYEVEKKYGILLEKGTSKVLPDGRTLVTLNKSTKISKLKNKISTIKNDIYSKLGNIENSHVKIIDLSEVIYSSKNITNNTYNVVGYITEVGKGKRFTDDVLLGLSNKDFLKVVAHLFCNFDNHYIPWENIWIDDNFMFYINILEDDFQIKFVDPPNLRTSLFPFLQWLSEYMLKKGYNPNAFFNIHFLQSKQKFLNLANSFDAYCDEHDIYYNSEYNMCPVCLETKYFVQKDFETIAQKVFEDSFAKHYRINERYNLKVYKATCEDLHQIEKNVDDIIHARINSSELKLGQDCFIPYKKAVDENKKFIGYIYEEVKFNQNEDGNNVCKDIQSTKQLKNLPRIKSLIRLIMQIDEITGKGMGFIRNPFSHVFLSKSHKKQVQILNIDFLSKKGNVEDTIKWTASYVKKVLKEDDSIEIDLPEQGISYFNLIFERLQEPGADKILLRVLMTNLQDLAKSMTKYCSIHDMYYTEKHIFCPKCVGNIKFEDIMLKKAEKAVITSTPSIAEGGEAFIYPYGTDLVAKVFKETEIDYNFKGNILACVFGKKDVLEAINNQNLKYRYIIPEKILVDEKSNEIFGYIMDRVEGMELSSLRDKNVFKELGFTMQDTLEILITVGQGIEYLHANDIFIGDLNGKNILFDKQKNVYFLDFDGMGINGISPEFCTEGYIDPVSKKNRQITMKDDYYSFAVQAFYYLTFVHPFNGIYSVRENGNVRKLDKVELMERRISLLGNHGMKAPTIAEPWDWMSNELRNAFLNIFEGDCRENIVPYLVRQYESMYKESSTDVDSKDDSMIKALLQIIDQDRVNSTPKEFRINPKFIAREIPYGMPPKEKSSINGAEFPSNIVVEKFLSYTDIIQYKGQRVCFMNRRFSDAKYKIIYDNTTKLSLVINSDGYAVIIDTNLNYTTFEIKMIMISNIKINVDNICFYERKVYIPSEDCLYITKIGDQIITKKMACPGIMTPNSKLYDFKTDGFSVMTNNKFYELRRG